MQPGGPERGSTRGAQRLARARASGDPNVPHPATRREAAALSGARAPELWEARCSLLSNGDSKTSLFKTILCTAPHSSQALRKCQLIFVNNPHEVCAC